MGAALTASRLRHVHGNRQVLALKELRVAAGGRLAVLGPNGSGKTTLLRLLAGIEPPTEGTVALDDQPIDELGLAVRRMVAYVGQQPGLLTTSVRRNVELPLIWRRVPRAQRAARVSEALDRFGIAHLADRPAQRLSGGERQRVNLARALATEPSVLLLDEPAAALDAGARRAFLDDLDHALDGDPTTIVHVSHRPEEALPRADLVAILDSGRLRQLGCPTEVVLAPADATVARIVGYHNVLPAVVDTHGAVRFRGRDLGINGTTAAGLVTVAVWATGLVLGPPGGPGIPADVRSVTPGPGRWEVRLDGPPPLLAHLPYGAAPPHVGQPVAVALLPDHCAIVPASDQSTC